MDFPALFRSRSRVTLKLLKPRAILGDKVVVCGVAEFLIERTDLE
ncbi:hypothetical protein ABIB73_003327 [Bradyrhizobium sp. F1.4.3]